MQSARRAVFALSISNALLSAATASAHIDLLEPEARAHGTAARGDTDIDVNSNLKNAPCGQITSERTDRVATYAPGQRITVRVREENAHVSYLRVRIDLDGAEFPLRTEAPAAAETQEEAAAAELALGADGLLAVVREDNDTPGFVHEIEVTLPNETCSACTLQVSQFMYDDPAAPHYFQCADLVLADTAVAGDAGVDPAGGAVGPNGTGTNAGGNSGPTNLGSDTPLEPEAVGSGRPDPAAGVNEMSANGPTTNAPPGTPAGRMPGDLQDPSGPALASPGGDAGSGCALSHATERAPRASYFVLAALGVASARRRRKGTVGLEGAMHEPRKRQLPALREIVTARYRRRPHESP